MLPVTPNDAVTAWEARQPIDAVPLMPAGIPAQEIARWSKVFEVIARFPVQKNDKGETMTWTYTPGQFDTWCFKEHIAYPALDEKGFPKSDAEALELYQVRSMAYAILREGYANVINRRTASGAPKITIRKP